MQKLATIGLSLAVLFLGGCEWVSDNVPHPDYYGTQAAEEAERKAITRPNILEEIQGPDDGYRIRKFETEFSDGTRVGCISLDSAANVSCVVLRGNL